MRKAIAALLVLLLLAGCFQEEFSGVPLSPAISAPSFTLTNQFGERVSLSDFRGKVVVMSFLYSNCRTVCPAITHKFVGTREKLGKAGRDVVFVAISVDPERDTPAAIRNFSKKTGIGDGWQFLSGDRRKLERIWGDYGVYVNKTQVEAPNNYMVDHTAIVFLIDREGKIRLTYPGIKWEPEKLVHDIKLLAKE